MKCLDRQIQVNQNIDGQVDLIVLSVCRSPVSIPAGAVDYSAGSINLENIVLM